jgi:RHS repeat-associated protein
MRRRAFRLLLSAFVSVAVLAGGLPAGAQEGDPAIEGPPGAQAIEIAPPDPPPPPLSEADRIPVLPEGQEVPVELEEAPLEWPPGEPVEEAAEDLIPVHEESGPDIDVFAVPEGGEHFALVYPLDVNYQNEDGDWVKIDESLVAEPGGWVNEGGPYTVHFPEVLDPTTPVRFEVPEGSLETALVGHELLGEGEADASSVTYEEALPGTDFVYRLTPVGYKELVVLHSLLASPVITWAVHADGLQLQSEDSGEISVLANSTVVGVIPAPAAFDSAVPALPLTAGFELVDLGVGDYELSLALDPVELIGATYPIVIDPGNSTLVPSADTYADAQQQSLRHDTSNYLFVGNPRYYSFLRFDTTGLTLAERIVTDATLTLRNQTQGDSATSVDARGVLADWLGSLTWNNMPQAGSTIHASVAGSAGARFRFQLESLYQGYLDGTTADYGVRLESADTKTFLATEAGGSVRPTLALAWNDLPPAPVLANPPAGTTVETPSPVLSVTGIPTDPNGDRVLVQFQVSDHPTDFRQDLHLKWESAWVEDTSQVVPAGVLADGQTYYWRVRSWDVCQEPDNMCNLTDGAGVRREQNSSATQALTVVLRHLGTDPRWAMWTKDLGNDMTVSVNQANGNLYLDVPFDSLATPPGDLSFGLSYNSQATDNRGLGAGWSVSAGPRGSTASLPVLLSPINQGVGGGWRVTFEDGGVAYYPASAVGAYSAGAGDGRLDSALDGTHILRTSDRDSYVFNPDGTLAQANVSWSLATPGTGYSYVFNNADHLTRITDPLGRQVNFTWTGSPERLTQVSSWDSRTWTIAYAGDKVSSVTDPTSATTSFLYGPNAKLATIKDGRAVQDGLAGWGVTYWTDTPANDPAQTVRVSVITAPGAPTGWDFDYVGPYRGATAAQTKLTDPRGTASPTLDDYQTLTDFNTGGLPLRIAGPADQTGYWPISTYVWDTNNNLVCQRGPAANAVAEHCTATLGTAHALSTVYTYHPKPPFRMLTVTYPAPGPDGTGGRATRTFGYDEGLTGLWLERFNNPNVAGIPVGQEMGTEMDNDWGFGAPPGLGVDYWSLRWTGYIHIDGTQSKRVKFRALHNDGVILVIEDSVLLSCFGTVVQGTEENCGLTEPGDPLVPKEIAKTLTPGDHPITIAFQDLGWEASFELQWDLETGVWETVPSSALRPNLGLLTSEAGPKLSTTYDFPTDEAKTRQLPARIISTDIATQVARTTAYTYDSSGRELTVTTAHGTALAATSTHTYTDNLTTSCLTRIVDPTGAVTDYTCNSAGDTLTETVTVRAVADQPAQTRVTTTGYDQLGGVTSVDPPGAGITTSTYDKAGRLSSVDTLVVGSTHAVTDFAYDPAGRLIIETLPDPDGGGPLLRPVVTHGYDWVDNETSRTDPRGKVWTAAYDAASRLISSTSPEGLLATAEYRLRVGGAYVNEVVSTSPAGVATVRKVDVLGRTTSERVGTTTATTYLYDVVGNVTRMTDPGGVWEENSYNGFRQITQRKAPYQTGVDAFTIYTYDAAGRVASVNGPRTDVTDVTTYTHDALDRLASVTDSGLVPPKTTTFAWDDASERVRVTDPENRVRDYTYDTNGRLATYEDSRGTTTNSYNAAGWLTSVGDPRGITLTLAYDNLGRRTSRSASTGGSDTETYVYDPAGNITSAQHGSVSTTLTYDDDSRLETVTQAGATTTYAYDPATGLLSSVADPAGTTGFGYNANGLLASLTDPFTSQPTSYTYDSAGRVITRTDPAGLTWTRTYFPLTGLVKAHVVKKGGNSRGNFQLSYDIAGNVKTRSVNVNTSPDNGDWTYAYDAANRLSSATDPAGVATTYGYDGAGNRNFVQVGQGPAVTTTYDQAGLPVSASDGTTYTHDQVGNLTGVNASGTADDWTYAYDPWNRMTRATGAAGAIDYAYDGLDRTVSRTEGASTTTYAYSGATHDPAREVTGGTTTLYAFSPDGPLAQKQGTTTRFYMTDPHDDVVGVASTAGSLVGTRSFSPWGEPRTTTGEQTLFGSQSDPTDPDTGLVDMMNRYYDPGMGRFTTRDVLFGDPTMPVSLNQYVYGADSPLTFSDPTGMAFESGGGSGSPSPPPVPTDWDVIHGNGPDPIVGNPYIQAPQQQPPELPKCKKKPWLCRKPNHTFKKFFAKKGIQHPTWFQNINDKMNSRRGNVASADRWRQPNADRQYALGNGTSPGLRFYLNMEATLRGIEWAEEHGGQCSSADADLIVVCYGADIASPAITVGNTIVTRYSRASRGLSSSLRAHEIRHSNQWARFGPAFSVIYAEAAIRSWVYGLDLSCYNPFEIEAGLGAGGYTGCPNAK